MSIYIYIYIYIYGSAPFVIVTIRIDRKVENNDAVQTRGGNMEETWQEHDGTDGQTDDYKVSSRTLGPTFSC